jgi:hypothetical protein
MKPSKALLELAWQFVVRHNVEFPDDPRFVREDLAPDIISKTPGCLVRQGLTLHVGHGSGRPCEIARRNSAGRSL